MSDFDIPTKRMKHPDDAMVPRVLVVAMFGLMAATLALVTFARVSGRAPTSVVPFSEITSEITVTLKGSRSAGVAIVDGNGTQLAHSTDDMNGFIDVIWASVTRERKVQNADLNAPVRVARLANGQTAIFDDTTGWSIELIGYGQDNVAAFARLLP